MSKYLIYVVDINWGLQEYRGVVVVLYLRIEKGVFCLYVKMDLIGIGKVDIQDVFVLVGVGYGDGVGCFCWISMSGDVKVVFGIIF